MFLKGHAVLCEVRPLLWLLIAPPIHLMQSGNRCYLVTVSLLNRRLTRRPGRECPHQLMRTFSFYVSQLLLSCKLNKITSFVQFQWCIFGSHTQKKKIQQPHSSHNESIVFSVQQKTWKRNPLLFWHICIVFFPSSLINSAELLQFTATLILPPSASPMKPIIAHLFILSTVSLKNHLCETIS